MSEGIAWERGLARSGNVLLSEDDDVECGHERLTKVSYQSTSEPHLHTDAVLLNMPEGFVVARYQRPSDVEDDVPAEEALDAPCKLL